MSGDPLWKQQCDAARRIRGRFGAGRALTYVVGEKFFNLVRDLEGDPHLAPDIEDCAAEIRTIFTPTELRDYFRRARARKHTGKPTDDLRYRPEEALFVAHMKMLLLEEQTASPSRSTLVQELVDRGIHPRTARSIVKRYSEGGIRQQVAYYDYERRTVTRADPEWLRMRIKEGWRPPEGYPSGASSDDRTSR